MKKITLVERHQAPARKQFLFRARALWVVQLLLVIPVNTKTMYGFENNNDMDLDIASKFAHQGQNSV